MENTFLKMSEVMDINSLVVFFKVAETSSFSQAARILEMPVSTVSRRISRLEEELNHKLIVRTTRKLSLTREGHELYQRAKPHLDQLDSIRYDFNHQQTLSGEIRITSTLEHRDYLSEKIALFKESYPDIKVFIHFSNEIKNMIEHSFDFSFRGGILPDANYYSMKLYEETLGAYMHKDFFHEGDIGNYADIEFAVMESTSYLEYDNDKIFKPEKKIVSNSIEFLVSYATRRKAIIYVPNRYCSEDFVLLNQFKTKHSNFQIVYLNRTQNRVCQVFLEFFKQFKE